MRVPGHIPIPGLSALDPMSSRKSLVPQIFLVGTAHVSRQSAEEVRELIRVVRPSTVMVELCTERAERMRSTPNVNTLVPCSFSPSLPLSAHSIG